MSPCFEDTNASVWATDGHKWLNLPYDCGIEFIRHSNALRAAMSISGDYLQELVELVDRNCDQAKWLAEQLSAAGFEVLNDVVLNQVVVSFGDPERTKRVVAALQEARDCWCGGTRWHGQEAMRISVSGWATTQEDMRATMQSILAAVRKRRS